jgi:hypothetical protein
MSTIYYVLIRKQLVPAYVAPAAVFRLTRVRVDAALHFGEDSPQISCVRIFFEDLTRLMSRKIKYESRN